MQMSATIAMLVLFSGPAPADTAHPGPPWRALAPATTLVDDAHTLFQPNAPDPGRSGQIEQLPQGGIGVTTGGTSHYQTLGTPNGSAVAVPNGNNTSSVIGSTGRFGTTTTPR